MKLPFYGQVHFSIDLLTTVIGKTIKEIKIVHRDSGAISITIFTESGECLRILVDAFFDDDEFQGLNHTVFTNINPFN